MTNVEIGLLGIIVTLLGFGGGVLMMGINKVGNKDCGFKHQELERRLKITDDYDQEWKASVEKRLENIERKMEERFSRIEKKIDNISLKRI